MNSQALKDSEAKQLMQSQHPQLGLTHGGGNNLTSNPGGSRTQRIILQPDRIQPQRKNGQPDNLNSGGVGGGEINFSSPNQAPNKNHAASQIMKPQIQVLYNNGMQNTPQSMLNQNKSEQSLELSATGMITGQQIIMGSNRQEAKSDMIKEARMRQLKKKSANQLIQSAENLRNLPNQVSPQTLQDVQMWDTQAVPLPPPSRAGARKLTRVVTSGIIQPNQGNNSPQVFNNSLKKMILIQPTTETTNGMGLNLQITRGSHQGYYEPPKVSTASSNNRGMIVSSSQPGSSRSNLSAAAVGIIPGQLISQSAKAQQVENPFGMNQPINTNYSAAQLSQPLRQSTTKSTADGSKKTTFDLDEHIRGVIKSVERKKKKSLTKIIPPGSNNMISELDHLENSTNFEQRRQTLQSQSTFSLDNQTIIQRQGLQNRQALSQSPNSHDPFPKYQPHLVTNYSQTQLALRNLNGSRIQPQPKKAAVNGVTFVSRQSLYNKNSLEEVKETLIRPVLQQSNWLHEGDFSIERSINQSQGKVQSRAGVVKLSNQFKRRNTSSIKRDSSQVIVGLAKSSSISGQNISGSVDAPRSSGINQTNMSATQRSIRIYRNQTKPNVTTLQNTSSDTQLRSKRDSQSKKTSLIITNASRISDVPKTQRMVGTIQLNKINMMSQQANDMFFNQPTSNNQPPPFLSSTQALSHVNLRQGLSNNNFKNQTTNIQGFLDRTIKTQTSEFISPQSNVIKTNHSANNQNAHQFFNYQNQPLQQSNRQGGGASAPFANNYQINSLKYERFQQMAFIQHFGLRAAFKSWRDYARQMTYNSKRSHLLDNFSFSAYLQGALSPKKADHLTLLHCQLLSQLNSLFFDDSVTLHSKTIQQHARPSSISPRNIAQRQSITAADFIKQTVHKLLSQITEALSFQESPQLLRFMKRGLTDGIKAFLNKNVHQIKDEDKYSAHIKLGEGSHLITVNPDLQSLKEAISNVAIEALNIVALIQAQVNLICQKINHQEQLANFDMSELSLKLELEISQIESQVNKLSTSTFLEVITSPIIIVTPNKTMLASPNSDQETWLQLNHYATQIEDHLPGNARIVFNYFILDGSQLKKTLLGKLKQVKLQIEKRVLLSLESDTTALKSELQKSLDTLQTTFPTQKQPLPLNLYLDQLNTFTVFQQPSMLSKLQQRFKQLQTLYNLLCSNTQHPSLLLLNLREIEHQLQRLPLLLQDCGDRLNSLKVQVEQQMHQSCVQLTQKIILFQRKYRERYVDTWQSKVKGGETSVISELQVREKTIEEIRGKVKGYQDCIEAAGMQEQFSRFKDVTCFTDFKSIEKLHLQTVEVWNQSLSINQLADIILNSSYQSLNFKEIELKLQDLSKTQSQDDRSLTDFQHWLHSQTNDHKLTIDSVKGLIILNKKHWMMLFHMMKGAYKDQFTITDLIKLKISKASPEVEEVVKIAENERKQWETVRGVQKALGEEGIKIRFREMPSVIPDGLLIIDVFDNTMEQLEDLTIRLKSIYKCQLSIPLDYDIEDQIIKLRDQIMMAQELVHLILDTQKSLQNSDALFSHEYIKEALSQEFSDYLELRKAFKKIINQLNENSSIGSFIRNQLEFKMDLEKLHDQLLDIQKIQDGFFEQRRLAFPRFFFMQNTQYLDFIKLVETNQDYSHLIDLIFPGADKLFFDKTNNKVPPHKPSHDSSHIESSVHNDRLSQSDNKWPPKEIYGMISKHRELLTFSKPVHYDHRDISGTLANVETTMQQTIGNLISQAVATFPKQSLDEWILDYPLQTIMTTIHLILTHEINELFEDLAQHKVARSDEESHKDDDEYEYPPNKQLPPYNPNEYGLQNEQMGAINEIVMTNKTPNTRDLVVATASSHAMRVGGGAHNHQRTISLQQLNQEFLKGLAAGTNGSVIGSNILPTLPLQQHQRTKSCQQIFTGSLRLAQLNLLNQPRDFTDDGTSTSQLTKPLMEEQLSIDNDQEDSHWLDFRRDMFGEDLFDIDNPYFNQRRQQIASGDTRENTMRILQEKSFRGLYLRLQFWINQICKSLRLNQAGDIMVKHNPCQRQMMQTIINFLSYQRDVVYEIKSKGVSHMEDFEWQKQLRLTWQGNSQDDTRGCRVDCGAWSTYQANEYIGNAAYRLPLTPLTNKYFVFIAAALREKSAVLFKCIPTHDSAKDVFEEFSNLCEVPFKTFHCASPHVTMKSLMQFLNGAALAQSWIFFEHFDKLDRLHLQTFNKEIQMVQQQFIIAELSQDDQEGHSSGMLNESHSIDEERKQLPQLQRSDEQLMFSRDRVSTLSRGNANSKPDGLRPNRNTSSIVKKRAVLQQSYDGNLINEMIKMINQDENNHGDSLPVSEGRVNNKNQVEVNQRKRKQSQHNSLTQHEYYEELQMDDQNNNKSSSKRHSTKKYHFSLNKVCFGVFASLSHRFLLSSHSNPSRMDLASSLQSAFRVLSLTRPELPLITTMFLKTHDFIFAHDLSELIHLALTRITDDYLIAQLRLISDYDDHFMTVNVREMHRFTYACACVSKRLGYEVRNIESEMSVVAATLKMFVVEKFQSYLTMIKGEYDEKAIIEEIGDIIASVFGIIEVIDLNKFIKSTNAPTQIIKETKLSKDQEAAVRTIQEQLDKKLPFCIIGGPSSGKQTVLSVALRSKQQIHFNPERMGSFRELYGIYDSTSLAFQAQQSQIGSNETSIFEVLRDYLNLHKDRVLNYEGCLSSPLVESLIPLLEFQQYRHENEPKLLLPNGLQTTFPRDTSIIFKQRSLSDCSPRLASALSIINLRNDLSLDLLLSQHDTPTQTLLTDTLKMYFSHLSHPQKLNTLQTFNQLVKLSSVQVAAYYALAMRMEVEMRAKWLKSQKMQDNAMYDFDQKMWVEIKEEVRVDGRIIVNRDYVRIKSIIERMRHIDCVVSGVQGSSRGTLLRYIGSKNERAVYLKDSTFMTLQKLRHIISRASSNSPTFIIEDINEDCKSLNYLQLIKINGGGFLFDPNYHKPTELPFKYTGYQIIASGDERLNIKSALTFTLLNPLGSPIFAQALLQIHQSHSKLSKISTTSFTSVSSFVRSLTTNIDKDAPFQLILNLSNPSKNQTSLHLKQFGDFNSFVSQLGTMLATKTPIQLNLGTERDLRYYQFAGLLMRAIQTFRENEDIKEFNLVDELSGRVLSKEISSAKELMECLKDVKFRITGESMEQIEEFKSQVPMIKEMCYEVKDDKTGLKQGDIHQQISSWIRDLSKDSAFNQSHFNVDYLSSQALLDQFVALTATFQSLLTSSLAKLEHTYTAYNSHYTSLLAAYQSTQSSDQQPLVTKTHLLYFNLKSLTDKVEVLRQQIRYRETTIDEREAEIEETRKLIEREDAHNNNEEVWCIIEGVTDREYSAMRAQSKEPAAAMVVQALGMILKTRKVMEVSVADIVQRVRNLEKDKLLPLQDPNLKDLINKLQKYQPTINQKSALESFISLLLALIKPQLTPDHKEQSKLKEKLSYLEALLTFYKQSMAQLIEEFEDIQIKEASVRAELKKASGNQEIKESPQLKSLRNDQMLKGVIKQGKRYYLKLQKAQIRQRCIQGDSMILAASVIYMSRFRFEDRIKIRKEVAERLLVKLNIESSQSWSISDNEQTHSKSFLKVLRQDLGLSTAFFTKLDHLVIDSVYAEFLFFLIYSPTIPLVQDFTGIHLNLLMNQALKRSNFKILSASNYSVGAALKEQLQMYSQVHVLTDFQDLKSHNQGRCLDNQDLNNIGNLSMARINSLFRDNPAIQFPQLVIASHSAEDQLSSSTLQGTSVIDCSLMNKNEAWIEVKLVLLKHFLPDNHHRLSIILQQVKNIKVKLKAQQTLFDELFLKIKPEGITSTNKDGANSLEDVRNCYIELRQLDEDYTQFNSAFHSMINEHPLLASYSNIFVIMYLALKELQRQTAGQAQEITYSWKVYIKLIDMIIAKIIRDLTLNMKNKQPSQQSQSGSQIKEDSHPHKQEGDSSTLKERERNNNMPSHGFGEAASEKNSKKREKEFTIDEDFFHSVIMPGIYTTVVAGIRQEYVPLFNLLFSLEISLKKTSISELEKAFFIKHFFAIKNCYDWRLNNHKPSTIPSGFVSQPELVVPKQQYLNLKKELVGMFPDLRKLFETLESKIKGDFTYKAVSTILYKKILKKESEDDSLKKWRDQPLMRKLLVGFICPDNEWRSKICQFVYEELSTIFDFNEDFNKLHNFIKTASWNLPVALFTQNSINIVNTVCSIASYYGVGLEVLRTDSQQSLKSQPNYYRDKNFTEGINHSQFWEAAVLNHQQLDTNVDGNLLSMKAQQEVVQSMFSKEEMETEEKQMSGIYHKTQINLIKKCAENGTWVLISTLKFPSYWDKICRKLERMASKGKILNTFRLFIDLQGYSVQEIPSSFLFDNCVKFYLTDRNNEDMEGFNDVWANILNDDLLNAKDINNVPLLIDTNMSNMSSRSQLNPSYPLGRDMHSVTSSSLLQPRLLQSRPQLDSPSLQSFSTPGSSRMQSIILNASGFDIQRDLRSPPRAQLTAKALLVSDKLGYKYKRHMHLTEDISLISPSREQLDYDTSTTPLYVGNGRDNNNQVLMLLEHQNQQLQPKDQEEVKSSSRKQGLKVVVANKKKGMHPQQQQPIEMIQQVGSNRGNKRMQPAQKGAH